MIVFGTIYNTDQPYSTESADPREAAIARYAWGDDYHVVIQARLERMLQWLREEAGAGLAGRPMSTRDRCRSASTRSTPAWAGSGRTPA